ncbi:MAG: LON peptidase substrate-binding domain-containing protein [Burkholderiaceae bacterium]
MTERVAPEGPASPLVELPIFPLSTVLFPEGVLPLRIFEARYMDMVRDCLKSETRFGVCLITDGGEVGQPAEHTPSGCSAAITEWDMEQLGLLNIRTIGQRRFSIESTRLESNGLIMAQVSFVDPEFDTAVPAEFAPCVALLERIVRDLVEKETEPMRKMIEPPYQFKSASWVSNRLCEFLPIPGPAKQKLMILNDPLARLSVVHDFLIKQDVI